MTRYQRSLLALFSLTLAFGLMACTGANANLDGDAASTATDEVAEKTPHPDGEFYHEPLSTGGEITRTDLVRFLDLGPANLLRQVPVSPVLDGQALVGYRIDSFFPDSPQFHGIDVRSGDIITAVNGVRIERPEHLFEVYESLRSAPRLQIDVMRYSTLRTMTWEIIDESAMMTD